MKFILIVFSVFTYPLIALGQYDFSVAEVRKYHFEELSYNQYIAEFYFTQDCIFWFDKNDVAGYELDKKERLFFFQNHGDFTLNDMINDNLISNENAIVGVNWFQLYKKGETLKVSFLDHRKGGKASIEIWICKHAVSIGKEKWSSYIKSIKNKGDARKTGDFIVILPPL